ncbi:MAG: hypothetical protein A2682_04075 [Candidatus Terrybacteria bacterium RIFCSPHIGHO2_01_FULL_58_15]|uniref:Uncharacterized protein n=1 Tax=Terrybacteria sp. (strain RIFCSPHIGHO2_01_FULL_58_15) TaxID=1802363 RepID=A0A1G2PJF8_TERXR|nr:MAG: hypothetical protein A2682_04075 [Candidatus Terrybacteria bacterium RIFCSPHIGHO2_01_FULL_58_15]
MDEIVPFAETNFRNRQQRFGIKTDDRRRHMYVIGKTGMGKTTLLENMVIDDIRAGRGVAVVDPHGEFAEKMLNFVPKERVEDVIYFNPSDLNHPIAFNAVEAVAPEYRHLITDGLVGVFQKLWAETWGPRLEYVLRNAILALLEVPDSTLLGIMRILTDKEYRKWVVAQVKDPVVRGFWVDEFSKYPDRFAAEAVAPIQNKVGQFLANPLIRNIVGQTRTAFDLREAMDSEKIVILNLSKGRIGEGTSRLLGAMMITKLQLAAMSRVDMPEAERRDFYLYVDEFQNFATVSFANILSEARKYRLDLILAHQYITQLEEEVRDAVFGNVGTLITFRVGAVDSEFLEKEFAPDFMMQDLVNISKYHIYLKLMIDGAASRAFSATTLAPHNVPEQSFREEIIEHTRRTYGSNREEVERVISEWAGPIESPTNVEAAGPAGRLRELHEAACWVCGKKTQVPFAPDGRRPIYCEKCLQEIRSGQREPLLARLGPPHSGYPNAVPVQQDRIRQEGLAREEGGPRSDGEGGSRQGERRAPERPHGGQGQSRHRGRQGGYRGVPGTEPVRRPDSGASISLTKLAPRPPAKEKGEPAAREHQDRPPRDRPEPDISGLRKILEDITKDE